MHLYSLRKSTLLLSLLCLLGLRALAQPAPARPVAIVTGHVRNPTRDTIAVAVRNNYLDPHEHISYARVNAAGDFRLVVPVAAATLADLVYGDDVADLYLAPGTSLDVQFKSQDMARTLRFGASGQRPGAALRGTARRPLTAGQRQHQRLANANAYLAEFNLQFLLNDGYQVLPDNILLGEREFLSFLNYRLKEQRRFLSERAEDEDLPADFYEYAKAEITYADANDRLTFQDLREQVVRSAPRLTLRPGYYDFLNDSLLLRGPATALSESFQYFTTNYIYFAASRQRQRADPDFYPYCYHLARGYLRGPARLLALGSIVQESFRFGHVRQSEALLAHYRTLDGKGRFWPVLAAGLAQQHKLETGALAPDFGLPGPAKDTLRLSDLRGKLVYLSFWKSTSGPCLYDLIYQQDLLRQFKGRDIVFVSINLDETDGNWRQLLAQRQLAGSQLRAAGGFQSATAKAYGVQAVPAYVLIGEDGTILSPRPKRPSSHAAIEELNQSFGKAARYQATLLPLDEDKQ
jgi:peroxiredoxin